MIEMPVLIATHNVGKAAEYAGMMDDLQIEWLNLSDLGVTNDVEETGQTFEENAILKAKAYARLTGYLTLADDSGLEVDFLDGAPGVRTARYGGEGLTAEERYQLLLAALDNLAWSERSARFQCVIALAEPDGRVLRTSEGICEGIIALEPQGSGGFGYDPVFFLPEYEKTMAELPPAEKHRISHRGRALQAMMPLLTHYLGQA